MSSRLPYLSLILVLLLGFTVAAQDAMTDDVPYLQSRSFNVPILDGWENHSSDDAAEFHLPEGSAVIRTALVDASDAREAAEAEIAKLAASEAGQPIYQGKVNLADGTWTVLVYDIDAETTASVMVRRAGPQFVVISFVEDDPSAKTLMLTMTQTNDALDDPTPEISLALEAISGASISDLRATGYEELPSGRWLILRSERLLALGTVFGNDSYIALQEGEIGDLAALADAYNRTLLGFFITPDNSLYLALGLAVVFMILAALLLSFAWRSRGISKDLELIAELSREEN